MSESAAGHCHLLENIRIVLVHTQHPGNIGGVARALKNMGLKQLCLVQPKCFPDPQASARAAAAEDILEQALVCQSLDEALVGCRLVVGSSARERRIPWPLTDARSAAQQILAEMITWQTHGHMQQAMQDQPVAVLFGREDRGLTNEELQLCNFHLNIPTSDGYSSLNLAAAVQVFCYELRMAALNNQVPIHPVWDIPPARSEDLQRYYEHLEKILVDIQFIDSRAPRQTMTRLKRLYNRLRPDEMELAILRGMLTQIEKIKFKL